MVENDAGPAYAAKVKYICNLLCQQLSITLLDSKYTYGEMVYTTKTTYVGETGCCGAVILAVEHRLNGILACPEQQRTGKRNPNPS